MRVLFCTDGSKISYASIKNFSKWVKDFTADVICAIDWSFLPDSVTIEDSEFAMKCTNSADSILDYTETYFEEIGVRLGEKIKICGSTVDCIMEACEKKSYDVIILGSNGKKGIQKWLGSVSQEIASVAKYSTYIAKENRLSSKILITVDDSQISENVCLKALEMLDLSDKELSLATVYEMPDYLFLEGNVDSGWFSEIDKKQEIAARILLNKYEKLFLDRGVNVHSKVTLSGNPANEILKYSDKMDIDLIVCGVRNRKYLSKLLLSSVSKRVLENTKSDVLIIRP